MTQAENPYRQDVFLENLRKEKDRQQQRIWAEHQQMQLSFLRRLWLQIFPPQSFDIGCGPMRFGSALIPLLKGGWYYGQDINPGTIAFGEDFSCETLVFLNRLATPVLLATSSSSRLIGLQMRLPIRCSATSH